MVFIRIMDQERTKVQHDGTKRMNPSKALLIPRAHQDDSYPTPVTNYTKTVGTGITQSPDRVQSPDKVHQIAMKCVSTTHSYFDHLSKIIR